MAFQQLVSSTTGLCRTFNGHCQKHGDFEVRYLVSPNTGRPLGHPNFSCPKCRIEEHFAWQKEHAAEIEAESLKREEEERLERERKEAAARQKAMELAIEQAAIPPEYEHSTLENYKPTTKQNAESFRQAKLYAENFDRVRNTGVGLFLYGKTGTGKSHIACSILKSLLPDIDGVYCMTWQIIKAVKEAPLGSNPLKAFMEASFLVIDELGVQSGTKFEESILYPLIDTRVTYRRPTIFISNVQPDSKEKSFDGITVRQVVGERIWDRIQQRSIFLRFDGESYRKRFKSVDDLLGETNES